VCIPHQRHIPPIDRNNQNLFRKEILAAAEEQSIGLITCFDLFRLARGIIVNNWPTSAVQDVLYSVGHIPPVPSHYQFVGTIEKHIRVNNIIGFQLQTAELAVDDKISFDLGLDYHEEAVESIEIDNNQVNHANVGDFVGIKTTLPKHQIQKRVRVYKVL